MATPQVPQFKPAGEHVTIIPPFAPVSTFIVYNRTGLPAEAAVVQMRRTTTVLSYFFSFKTLRFSFKCRIQNANGFIPLILNNFHIVQSYIYIYVMYIYMYISKK